MLGPNVDITHFFEPHAFQRFYSFKEPVKDEQITTIREKENSYQTMGIGASIPFIIMTLKQRDIKYFLPALISVAGFKYYSSKVR